MRRILVLSLLASLLALLPARLPAQGWARTIGGPIYDHADAVQPTSDGGVIVVGATWRTSSDCWVLKLDATGAVTWQKAIGFGWDDEALALAETAGGGFLVAGTKRGFTSADSALLLLALDRDGGIAWQETLAFGNPVFGPPRPTAVAALGDGTFTVVGTLQWEDAGWFVQVDALGGVIRHDQFGLTSEAMLPTAVWPTPGGGFVVGGKDVRRGVAWLRVLDAAGTTVRSTSLALDCCYVQEASLAPTSDGGCLLAGKVVQRAPPNLPQAFVVKADSTFATTWAELVGPEGSAVTPRAVGQAADGSYIVAGESAWPPSALAMSLDGTGAVRWQRAYGPRSGTVTELTPTADGGAVIVGATQPAETSTDYDALLLRVDAAGLTSTGCGEITDTAFATAPTATTWTDVGVDVTPISATVAVASATSVDTTAALVDVGDAHEPDDSCTSRGVLLEGETTRRDFCDDAEDWYQLIACQGVQYTIATSALGALANTVIELYSPDCSVILTTDDDGGGGLASRVDWVAPTDGRFPVRVRQLDATVGPGRQYDVGLVRTGPGCATWARAYGSNDYAADVASLPDGTFAVALTQEWDDDDPTLLPGPVVLHLDGSGSVLRQVRLLVPQEAWATDVEATDGGGFAVAGWVRDGATATAGFVREVDAGGTLLWQKVYQRDFATGTIERVRQLRDGGFAAVGFVGSFGSMAPWIIRLDADGTPAWDLVLGNGRWSTARDVAEMSDGDLLVVGRDDDLGAWIIRLGPGGQVEGQRVYDSSGYGAAAVVEAADGGFFVTGGNAVLKLDRTGNAEWVRNYGTAFDNQLKAASVVSTADRGCIVAGYGYTLIGSSPLVVKLSAAGIIEWRRTTVAQSSGGSFSGISPTLDGGLVLAGSATAADGQPQDFVLRADRDGLLREPCLTGDAWLSMSTPWLGWMDTNALAVPGTLTTADAGFVEVDRGVGYTELCAGSDPGPPKEVSPPGSSEPLVFTDHVTLRWEQAAASGATTFNLYRGELPIPPSRRHGACLLADLATNSAVDAATPPLGVTWTYLVAGKNAAGEGPLGHASNGGQRIAALPCP